MYMNLEYFLWWLNSIGLYERKRIGLQVLGEYLSILVLDSKTFARYKDYEVMDWYLDGDGIIVKLQFCEQSDDYDTGRIKRLRPDDYGTWKCRRRYKKGKNYRNGFEFKVEDDLPPKEKDIECLVETDLLADDPMWEPATKGHNGVKIYHKREEK